jgi:hypothetical protein
MNVAIINTRAKGTEVHAAGCADVAKSAKRNGDEAWVIDVASKLDLSHTYWNDQIGDTVDPDSAEGWATAASWMTEFNFLPCCGDLPEGNIVVPAIHAYVGAAKGKCDLCGKTRNAKAHKQARLIELADVEVDPATVTPEVTPATETPEVAAPEKLVSIWVGWRIADVAIARGGSLGAKLAARKPNSVLDRTVRLTYTELVALMTVADSVAAGATHDGPLLYSAKTHRARAEKALEAL